MAKALQCPTCGSTTRLEGLETGGTVRCESCGQVMKVPPGVERRSSRGSSPAAPAAPVAEAAVSAVPAPVAAATGGAATAAVAPPPPAPRRRSRPTTTAGGGAVVAAGGTAVMAPGEVPPIATPAAEAPRSRRGRTGDATGGRETLPLPLRVVAWVIALPLGLVIVGYPARQLGYLSSQKLLDVIVKHDLSRFVPIVVVVAVWALVTAVLVTAFVEGGRRWMLARRARGSRDPADSRSGGGRSGRRKS